MYRNTHTHRTLHPELGLSGDGGNAHGFLFVLDGTTGGVRRGKGTASLLTGDEGAPSRAGHLLVTNGRRVEDSCRTVGTPFPLPFF